MNINASDLYRELQKCEVGSSVVCTDGDGNDYFVRHVVHDGDKTILQLVVIKEQD